MKRVLKWVAVLIVLLVGGAVALAWTPDSDPVQMRTK